MRIISMSNNKGGVGKTTSTVNIAACLQILGKKVMVIDLDPQAQSTYHFGISQNRFDQPIKMDKTIYDVMKGEVSYRDTIIDRNGIDIIAFQPRPSRTGVYCSSGKGISFARYA